MAQLGSAKAKGKILELCTFFTGEAQFGLDILKVQEINKLMEMTKVPQAPSYVLGVLNLRGRIVTVIDLGKKLGLSPTSLSNESRNIIVDSQDEYIGLLVDQIGDVVLADWNEVDPPPANIGAIQGRFFEGVFKAKNNLIGIMDVEEVLKDENQ